MRHALLLLVAAIGLGSSSCRGCGCVFEETAGTARITAIQAGSDLPCPNGSVEVLFDFTPTDPSKADKAATGVQLQVGQGSVEASGLSVGSSHRATRLDQTRGACSPLGFQLDDVDYVAACAGK